MAEIGRNFSYSFFPNQCRSYLIDITDTVANIYEVIEQWLEISNKTSCYTN